MTTTLGDVSNSSTLSNIAEDTILATLRERYSSSQQYTGIGPSALVSINPLTYLPLNGDGYLQDYVSEYYESAGDDAVGDSEGISKEKLGMHIFRLGLSAYYNMRRTGQDQIVLMR